MDFSRFKTKSKFRWRKITVSLNMRTPSMIWPIINISSKCITIRIFLILTADIGVFNNFVKTLELVLSRNINRETRKDSLTMKTEHNSLMTDVVKLKNNHLSYSACTCNLPPEVSRIVTQTFHFEILIWKNCFKYLKFTTGRLPPSLFPNKKIFLKNSQAWCSVYYMTQFFNMFFISTCIRAACSWLLCGVWGILFCVGIFRKTILNPFTISKISGSFVSISHVPKNALTFLLVPILELFLQRTSFLPMNERSSDEWRFPLCLFLPWKPLLLLVAGR